MLVNYHKTETNDDFQKTNNQQQFLPSYDKISQHDEQNYYQTSFIGVQFQENIKDDDIKELSSQNDLIVKLEILENTKLKIQKINFSRDCLLYTSPSPRDRQKSRMPSSA
eukprot:TRINITY_DN18157_c0_g1_i1.p5 TRINITY_DN18157_c0_g1~~TRINITY_DN18157_c0_g1_i1.p5  ORF type:complete len:110 (+),score=27.84 TRINITY_DN18157_c0_g1_i1:1318-1647(+)